MKWKDVKNIRGLRSVTTIGSSNIIGSTITAVFWILIAGLIGPDSYGELSYFLAIIGLLSTVIAAFYYLRIIKVIYFDPEKEKYDTDHHLGLKITLFLSTVFILIYFISPNGLVELVSKINII